MKQYIFIILIFPAIFAGCGSNGKESNDSKPKSITELGVTISKKHTPIQTIFVDKINPTDPVNGININTDKNLTIPSVDDSTKIDPLKAGIKIAE